jgi:two-component system chemotaxis response regulator CheB
MNEEEGTAGRPMPSEQKKIRVLVVDDSALMRKLISKLLESDPEIEVIGTAIDGCFALTRVEQLKPDVVTLDVDMPRMDGLTALSELVSKHHTPVIMLSSLTTRGAALTMQALEKGAVDFVCKPTGTVRLPEMADELVSKIKAAARTNLRALGSVLPREAPVRKKRPYEGHSRGAERIVAIGASSGGPHALRYLLPRIPSNLDAGIVIVQHMPESFTKMLAHWLNEICELDIKEAESGDLALPGRVLIAPGNLHMKVRKTAAGCQVLLEGGALVSGHKPSVDVLFRSVAEEYGSLATGVIMTGMGSDGAQGLGEIQGAGGNTIAQDKESCAVYGMPRVAVERGFANKIVPLADLASYLSSEVGRIAAVEKSHASK